MSVATKPLATAARAGFSQNELEAIRSEFPIFAEQRTGKPLVYLDSAATTQKPHRVLCALETYYRTQNSNVHRGVHTLSQQATQAFEAARKRVAGFINAPLTCEVIWTRGATESLNLVAQSFARPRLSEGDEIVLTHMEHHSNIVPWQMVCEQTGAKIVVAPIKDDGSLDVEKLAGRLTGRTKLLAVTHVSNALGTVNPIHEIVRMAHDAGVPVVVDGAQAVPHAPVDVQALDCDFYVFSGHKMYGPTGVGVLYGKAEHLDAMPPYQGGGDMILSVTFEKTTYNSLPHKFEAGTPNIAGVIGLGAAAEYLASIGMDRIAAHEAELLAYGTERLAALEGLRLIGTAAHKAGVLSFTMDCAHPHDIGQILDDVGVAVRAGHHCAQPVMERFGVPATARASLGLYNRREDIDALVEGLQTVREILG